MCKLFAKLNYIVQSHGFKINYPLLDVHLKWLTHIPYRLSNTFQAYILNQCLISSIEVVSALLLVTLT